MPSNLLEFVLKLFCLAQRRRERNGVCEPVLKGNGPVSERADEIHVGKIKEHLIAWNMRCFQCCHELRIDAGKERITSVAQLSRDSDLMQRQDSFVRQDPDTGEACGRSISLGVMMRPSSDHSKAREYGVVHQQNEATGGSQIVVLRHKELMTHARMNARGEIQETTHCSVKFFLARIIPNEQF